MLRDKSLVPLSRQHQHALALCVRIDRASPVSDFDLAAWQAEITQLFRAEITIHFAAEEAFIFPVSRQFKDLTLLVGELITDHTKLRQSFTKAEAGAMSAQDLLEFAQQMSAHIRKEERQLFERMQELMKPEELARLGQDLEEALKDAVQACALPARPAE